MPNEAKKPDDGVFESRSARAGLVAGLARHLNLDDALPRGDLEDIFQALCLLAGRLQLRIGGGKVTVGAVELAADRVARNAGRIAPGRGRMSQQASLSAQLARLETEAMRHEYRANSLAVGLAESRAALARVRGALSLPADCPLDEILDKVAMYRRSSFRT